MLNYADWVPHSCGHRACPRCRHHETQQWLQRQQRRQLPVTYFLVTFTLPGALRELAWAHQRLVYDRMIRCAWQTLAQFARNFRQLHGDTGVIAVLHTHSRRLDYHPHVHLVVSAGAVDAKARCWRTKHMRKKNPKPYLFSHNALASDSRPSTEYATNNAFTTIDSLCHGHACRAANGTARSCAQQRQSIF